MDHFQLGIEYIQGKNGQPDTFANCNILDEYIFSIVTMSVWETKPPHASEDYWIYICNRKSLTCLHNAFFRYILILDQLDIGRTNDFLFKLAKKSTVSGPVWQSFREYVALEYEEAEWHPDVPAGEKAPPGYEPSLSWRFENVEDIPPTQTVYDERIVIDISWPEDGTTQSFRGYWYTTSTAFIAQRLEFQDPYYRRYIQISHVFDRTQLEMQLQETLSYLAALHPSKRPHYLKHHFECDGQTMFYSR